ERMLSNLAAGRPLTEEVPGIVYDDRTGITSSPPCAPLLPKQIPTPDYDDMPLGRYLSAEITLPLLSSRGCYWGKCEFCHHHMVYGGKYNAYEVEKILESIRSLSHRYGVHHFAFNDEAIPPKIMRAMGQLFPANAETGWNFTGLIKFEKYFQRDDFVNLQRVGFRSLYVGLESASERVLSLMHKNNTKETMIRNLSDATSAGIWMHNFLFFGFPGETDEDAQETYDFVLTNSDIISSFGTAVFVLEHNAPIFHHLRDFGVEIRPSALDDVDVYYEFDLTSGIAPPRAREWMRKLNNAALDIPSYNAAGWVPRELQLCLLSIMPPGELVDRGLSIRRFGGLPPGATLPDIVSWEATPNEDTGVAINRVNGRTVQVTGASASLLELCHSKEVSLVDMKAAAPAFFDHLVFPSARLTSEAVMSPVPAPLSAGSVAH
ncbi:MAG TPA: radical SAM protein, partial [Thermomicrobiales bacterium]|nr:radical SAM protein [Thermomicrobiales bacterium]